METSHWPVHAKLIVLSSWLRGRQSFGFLLFQGRELNGIQKSKRCLLPDLLPQVLQELCGSIMYQSHILCFGLSTDQGIHQSSLWLIQMNKTPSVFKWLANTIRHSRETPHAHFLASLEVSRLRLIPHGCLKMPSHQWWFSGHRDQTSKLSGIRLLTK